MRTIEHTFQVMTYDIDFAGLVNNICYPRWLEDLRNLFADQTLWLGDAFPRLNLESFFKYGQAPNTSYL